MHVRPRVISVISTMPARVAGDDRPVGWLHRLCLFGPVIVCTGVALVLALRALPLAGWARVLFAAAVALNVALVALSSWGSILGITAMRRNRGVAPPGL